MCDVAVELVASHSDTAAERGTGFVRKGCGGIRRTSYLFRYLDDDENFAFDDDLDLWTT